MDITERKITKIAREVSKFTVRTLRAEGIGQGEIRRAACDPQKPRHHAIGRVPHHGL